MPATGAPIPRTPVRVINSRGDSTLVEWIEMIDGVPHPHRAYVPDRSVQDNTVSALTLKRGIPYGLPWESIITITATPENIANELRRRGIWTYDDISGGAIFSVVNRAFDVGTLINKAKEKSNRG